MRCASEESLCHTGINMFHYKSGTSTTNAMYLLKFQMTDKIEAN